MTLLEDRVNPSPVQFFYIPMPESQTNAAFDAIVDEAISTTEESITAITVTENNTTIWYDHWEDGYEAILGNPQQATTRVWGDGNNANGIAPGFANDPTGLPSGTVFRLRNTVNTPRNLTTQPILFDSPDKFGSDRTISVSRAQFPTTVSGGGGSVISSAVEVRDTRFYDTNYRAPVGVNTADSGSMFTFAAFFVQAFLDNTRVQIDANNDSDFTDPGDRDVILNQGETIVSGQSVVQGGRVVADKPVQTQFMTGEINANYASRSYTLFSDAQAANDYFTPVGFGGPSDDTNDEVRLFVFNPNAVSIQVRQERDTGIVTTKTIAAGASTFFDVNYNSGTRLFSVGGQSFLALGTHDQQGTTHDWGFSLQPTPALSQIAIVGLGVGNSAEPPSSVTNANVNTGAGELPNSSPIFVTALGNTTLFVDHNNDGVIDQTIPVTRLQSLRLRDTTTNDNDNSGMRIFTTDGTLISVAWGEDGTAPAGSPGFDAGTTIPAISVPEYYKFSEFAPGGDINGDGFFNEGDVIRYSLRIRHIGTQPISNAVVTDILPITQVTYLTGTTTLTIGASTTPIPDDGTGTAFPLDGTGFTVTSLLPGQTVFVAFDARINTGLPPGFNFILNQSVLTYDIFRLPANDVIDLRGTVGDRVWYDVDGDGVQDAGEPGIAGATVTITWFGPNGVAGGGDDDTFTTTTGANGIWSLTNLPTGNFTTAISGLPNGLTTQTFGPSSFSLPAGQVNRTDLDFGYRGTGTIGNFAWLDLDNDAVQDANEPGLAGATVTLTWAGFDGTLGSADDVVYPAVSTTATAPGVANYSFANLPSGNFQVLFAPPAGGTLVAQNQGGNANLDSDPIPANGLTGTIALAVGATNNTIDAGMRLTADLQITKTDGTATVVPGQGMTYTIVVTNVGPSAVTGASIVDALPAALTGVSWTSSVAGGAVVTSGGTGSGNTLAAVANLPIGASVTFTVSATLNPAFTGTLSNTATVSAPAGVTDPTPGNNSATDTSTADPRADLRITKTDGVATVVPGQGVTYTIVVTNTGPSAVTGATVADTLPAALTGVSWTSTVAGGASMTNGGTGSGNTLAAVANLPSGGSVTFTVDATLDPAFTGTLSNSATVMAPVGVTDPTPGNNTATDTSVADPRADLRITKTDGTATVIPGQGVTYTIVVTNVGPSAVTGASIADALPGALTGVSWTSSVAGGASVTSGGTGSGNTLAAVANLPSGGSVTFTVSATLNPAFTGTLSNTATVSAPAGVTDPTPGNNTATETSTADPTADLIVVKSDGGAVVTPGEVIIYNLTLTNNGPSHTGAITLTDAIPALTSFVTASDGGTLSAGVVSWNLPSLAPGVSTTVSIQLRVNSSVPAGVTQISNSATALGSVPDPTPGNNTGGDTTPVVAAPDLQVTKDDGLSTVKPGELATYTISVTNVGNQDATGVTLSETVPANTTFVPGGSSAGWNPTGTMLNVGALAVGEVVTFTYQVRVNDPFPVGASQIANTVSVADDGANGPDPTPGNNTAADTTTVANGRIGDRVFLDANGNSIQDAGEAGVPGVTVRLLDAGSLAEIATVVTGTDGDYQFKNLPVGDYKVAFGNSDGISTFAFGAPNQGGDDAIDSDAAADGVTDTISLAGGQQTADVDAGVFVPVIIGDTVYFDANGDGTQNPGEPGIPGVTVRLFYAGPDGVFDATELAKTVQTSTTGADGTYSFIGLPPGAYRVSVDPNQPVLVGFGMTVPTVPSEQPTTLASGQSDASRDFAFTGTGSLGDRVWLDRNGDGAQDADEPGLSGRAVSVVWLGFDGVAGGGDDVAYPPVLTGADGTYAHGSLPLGKFVVSLDVAGSNLVPTFDADGGADGTAVLELMAAVPSVENADFGLRGTASVGDRVFQDIDGDGVFDAGAELGIPGATVVLRWAGVDGVLDTPDDSTFTATTDANGLYNFDGLPVFGATDPYRVTISVPSAGYVPTGDLDGVATPNEATLDLGPTDARTDADFGLGGGPGQSIAGRVYHDLNADGDRDSGEPGLAGVVVRLAGLDAFGRPIVDPATGLAYFEATTGASGAYSFAGLVPGTYSVSQPVQPPAYNDGFESLGNLGGFVGNDLLSNIPIGGRAPGVGYDFGELGVAVAGSVYRDSDRDGVRDAGESGVPGVTVELRDTAGNPVLDPATGQPYQAVTGADGAYAFLNVPLGTYQIVETQPAGYADGPVGPATVRPVVVPSNGLTGQDFAEVLGQISGTVYLDANLNATRDAGETGLAGVAITLTGTDLFGNVVNRTTTTDVDGRYVFDNLFPANAIGYTLTEAPVPTLNDGTPNAPGTAGGTANGPNVFSGIQPASDRQDGGYDFGEFGVPVSGMVFIDTNRNGERDANETPLPGVLIELLDSNGAVVASTTTDADGSYLFPNVFPGDYTIRETQPVTFGNPANGPAASNTRSLYVGTSPINGIEFGDTPGSIVGAVYLDQNRNGLRDVGEPGIAGVTITLTGTDLGGAPVSRTTMTAADGSYRYDNLLAGVYAIAEAQPATFGQGTNAIGTAGGQIVATDIVGQINLVPGAIVDGYLFGEQTLDNTPIPQPVAPLPPLPPFTVIAPVDISKRRFLSSSASGGPVAPITGRTQPDFAALRSVSTTRDPVFLATAEGQGGELVRVFDLTGGQERFRFRPFPGNPGGVRVATADISGDGIPDIVVAAGPGGAPRVIVYDGNTGAVLQDFLAFEATFTGGLFVAAGDMDGDGRAELILTPDEGGGPRVKVLAAGDPNRVIADFWGIDDPSFRGGARAAVGDLDGDGTADLAVGAGVGGGPRVAVWDGASLTGNGPATRLAPDFFAFEDTLRNGVYLTIGDIDGDGRGDLMAGAGPGGAPRVIGFSALSVLTGQPAVMASYFVGDSVDRGGVPLVAVDLDGDGQTEILTGTGEGSLPTVRFSNPRTGATIDAFAAEYMDFLGGVQVG
ncbi:MAG: DUF11 domain-containing protein [Gemmataceae bacterium]|nr:DUF11 domain-containing protein [Gemmataceae bacterium]